MASVNQWFKKTNTLYGVNRRRYDSSLNILQEALPQYSVSYCCFLLHNNGVSVGQALQSHFKNNNNNNNDSNTNNHSNTNNALVSPRKRKLSAKKSNYTPKKRRKIIDLTGDKEIPNDINSDSDSKNKHNQNSKKPKPPNDLFTRLSNVFVAKLQIINK
eukprot:459555_1